MYVLKSLTDVRELTEIWIREYNEERAHDALNDLTQWGCLAKHQGLENSNYECR
ncbi:Transposase and inactivated derivatives [Hahella chejuensis KCTC 2396]|uniref:Transposase and inactivated derivatives n=1 Tax=Hahella chejuensis (strain KCTC 2396) TaxID=349521 RepID=Q2SCA9_HAHCH|nr:Transposase and inactivated derivatives [Hahella chejuensis KCTC 2396]